MGFTVNWEVKTVNTDIVGFNCLPIWREAAFGQLSTVNSVHSWIHLQQETKKQKLSAGRGVLHFLWWKPTGSYISRILDGKSKGQGISKTSRSYKDIVERKNKCGSRHRWVENCVFLSFCIFNIFHIKGKIQLLKEKYAKPAANSCKMCGDFTCLNVFVEVGKPTADLLEWNSYILSVFKSNLSGCVPKPTPSLNWFCCHCCQQWQDCHLIQSSWDYAHPSSLLLTGILDNLCQKGEFFLGDWFFFGGGGFP